MVKRASPGVGHNLPEPADFRKALAVEILDQEEAKKLREKRKANRKAAEGKNVNLSDLDATYQHRDDTFEEIVVFIKRRLHGFAAVWTDLFEQFDLLAPKAEAPEVRGAIYHAGLMAGVTGKPNIPPPGMVGDALQKWQLGYNEGAQARDEAEKEKLAIWQKAIDNANAGKVTDGKTGEAVDEKSTKPKRSPKAQATADQAAKDFAEDNQPDWSGYSAMPAEWTDAQRKTAKAWVDSVPADFTPTIQHPGAKTFFDVQRQAQKTLDDAAPKEGGEGEAGGDSAPDKPAESQSEKAARLAQEAGIS